MRHLFRSIRSRKIYLVPASLLAIAGALLLDALRQVQIERQTQGQTLMYRFELDPSSQEQPVTRLTPANGDTLIKL